MPSIACRSKYGPKIINASELSLWNKRVPILHRLSLGWKHLLSGPWARCIRLVCGMQYKRFPFVKIMDCTLRSTELVKTDIDSIL